MKRLTKVMAALLAMLLCVTMLGACGSKEDTIKIGFIGPLTGDTAQYGESVRNGAKMYFDEINEAGGINGKLIEFIEMDTEGDNAVATTAYTSLYDEGVIAIIGPVLTGETGAVAELAEEDGMPLVTASATGDTLTDLGDALFRTCFNDSFQGGKMADFAAHELGVRTAAVMTNTASDYSKGLADAFKVACAANGITIVAEESYVEGDTDFKAQLTNLSAESFDILYVPDYYQTVALIAQQAKATGVNAPMFGGDGYTGVIAQVNDDSILEGFVFTDHYSPEASDAGTAFAAQYLELYDVEPLSFSFLAYDAAMIVVNAAKTADTREAMMEAIAATDLDCLTSHYVFDEDNNPVKECAMRTVENGEYKFLTMF